MSGRIVVISGASSGLGLNLAGQFLKAGDTVYGVTQTRSHWPSAKERLSDYPDQFFLFRADCSRETAVKRFITTVQKKAGRLDILINNAGYANPPVRTEDESAREFTKNFTGNLLSAFLMSKYALPTLLQRKKGWIINISSMAGKRAVPRLAAYSAAKFGLVALSQCLAKENPIPGFKCISVCPGGINTEMRAKLFGNDDAKRQQSAGFVAEKVFEIVEGKITVESGGDICIRHGKITAINPAPAA